VALAVLPPAIRNQKTPAWPQAQPKDHLILDKADHAASPLVKIASGTSLTPN